MTVTEITETVQDQIVESLKTVQDAIVDSARLTAETLEGLLPDLSSLPLVDRLPDPTKAAEDAIKFAERMYAAQKDFALGLVDAARPLVGKGADSDTAAA